MNKSFQRQTTAKINQDNIYLQDTIETFKFEKDALQIKFKHNIHQLTNKNRQFSNILKQLIFREQREIVNECQTFKKMIDTCIGIQDSLTGLDTLQLKTNILKNQLELIKEKLENQGQIYDKQ